MARVESSPAKIKQKWVLSDSTALLHHRNSMQPLGLAGMSAES